MVIAGGETCLPIEALLAALYQSHEVQRPVFDVLSELLALAPVDGSVTHPAPGGLLVREAEEKGWCIITAFREEDGIYAEIGWRPTRDASALHACVCRFPTGTGDGEWVPQGPVALAEVLGAELHRQLPGPPRVLLSAAGEDYIRRLPQS